MTVEQDKRLLNDDGSVRDRIVGIETEYGLTAHDKLNDRHSSSYTNMMLLAGFSSPDITSQYMKAGERIYLDLTHPEYSTVEETNFAMTALRVLRGHLIMADRVKAAVELRRPYNDNLGRVNLFANTRDTTGNSYGSHENMLTTRQLELTDFADAMIAQRVSRIVWSGVGSPSLRMKSRKYSFELSEKAPFIYEQIGQGTTHSRPLVNTRDEPLADKERFKRKHDVAGESNFNPRVIARRLAADSILLRACELGVSFNDLVPENPIQALQVTSEDPSLKARFSIKNGMYVTGIELQKLLFERGLTEAARADYLTEQENWWGQEIITLLDDLDRDPDSCDTRVEWIVKKRAIERALADNKRDPLISDYNVATQKSIEYSRIYPSDGLGMKLLKHGFFEDSPKESFWEQDLPMSDNRAKVRRYVMERCVELGLRYTMSWEASYIMPMLGRYDYGIRLKMDDPYSTSTDAAEEIIDKILVSQLP